MSDIWQLLGRAGDHRFTLSAVDADGVGNTGWVVYDKKGIELAQDYGLVYAIEKALEKIK